MPLPLLLLPLLLFACVSCSLNQPQQPLTLAVTRLIDSAPLFVAYEKGFLGRHGFSARLELHDTGREALESALAGRSDFATVADYPLARAAVEGKPAVVVATVSMNPEVMKLVTREGITTPTDLRGKKVGVTAGTSGDFFLDGMLVMNLLPASAVSRVNLPPPALVDAVA
ncbi:MAG TPA: ABC transporter substrate-binding protein, partial [Verrucomicrobiae bacterium]|nr:ABC transporter substrate-binding protein [Verrucomicrobiae bacterium]